MNTLYSVTSTHWGHRRIYTIVHMVTADTPDLAQAAARNSVGPEWEQQAPRIVCTTPDSVFKQV